MGTIFSKKVDSNKPTEVIEDSTSSEEENIEVVSRIEMYILIMNELYKWFYEISTRDHTAVENPPNDRISSIDIVDDMQTENHDKSRDF
jgi:hypothetical protein